MSGAALDLVLSRLQGVKKEGKGWKARCPAHEDHNPSLSIGEGEGGRVLLSDHAGCDLTAICAAIQFTPADLFEKDGDDGRAHEIVAEYDYTDEAGAPLFQVVRFAPKDFRQRCKLNGEWLWKLGKTRRVLYRLPQVLATAEAGGTVYVVEGEKDVHAIEQLGAVATCNPGGAGKWKPEYSEFLHGAVVVIIADKDEPGRTHAATVAASVEPPAASVRIVEAAEGKDAADHVAAGHGLEDFVTVEPGAAGNGNAAQPARAADGRRQIVISDRPLRDISDEAIAALTAANTPPVLFTQAPFIVRLRQDAGRRLRIERVGDDGLRYQLTGAVDFKTMIKGGGVRHANPPKDVLRNINATPDPPFPQLETLRTSPVLRPDYSIVTQTGYDAESRVFYAPPPGFVLPPLPPLPEALGWLDEALGAFCYADAASRANAYALLLTPVLRLVLRGNVPLAVIDSPQQGSGKSCLVNVISLIATGAPASTVSEPEDDAEWRKMLTSALRRGDELLTIDNVTRQIKSARLAEFITTEWWTDRLLGGNELPSLAQRMSVTVTGNNLGLGGDMGRRCYLILLDAKCARPWIDRHYPHPDLQAWVIANRGSLLASVLTLVDSWVKDGTPPAPGTPWLGNFGDWCQVIGAILTHAGIAEFLGNIESVYSALDVEAEQWEAFLQALREQYGEHPFTSAQLALEVGADGQLHDAAPDGLEWVLKGGSEGLTIRLGKALRKQVGRRYGAPTMRITSRKDSHTRKTVWVVEAEQGELCA